MKKIISILLTITLLFSFSTLGISAKEFSQTKEVMTLQNYQQKIINEVIKDENVNNQTVELISLNDEINSRSSLESEFAIKISDENGAKIIVPYVVVDDEIVNSFSYVKHSINNRSIEIPVNHLSDLKLTLYAGYDSIYMKNGIIAYRPTKMYGYWTSKKSGVHVSNLSINYDYQGQHWDTSSLYCIKKLVNGAYQVQQYNPKQNSRYYGKLKPKSVFISHGTGIVPTNFLTHGSVMSYEISYTTRNGKSRYDKYSFDIFGK